MERRGWPVKAFTFTYSDVLADSKLKDIIYSIEPVYTAAHTLHKNIGGSSKFLHPSTAFHESCFTLHHRRSEPFTFSVDART